MSIASFFRQPSTIAGISALAAAAVGAVTGYLSGSEPLAVAVGTVVAGIVNIVLPDNTAAASASEKLVADVVAAIEARKGTAPVVAAAVADAPAVIAAVVTPAVKS